MAKLTVTVTRPVKLAPGAPVSLECVGGMWATETVDLSERGPPPRPRPPGRGAGAGAFNPEELNNVIPGSPRAGGSESYGPPLREERRVTFFPELKEQARPTGACTAPGGRRARAHARRGGPGSLR